MSHSILSITRPPEVAPSSADRVSLRDEEKRLAAYVVVAEDEAAADAAQDGRERGVMIAVALMILALLLAGLIRGERIAGQPAKPADREAAMDAPSGAPTIPGEWTIRFDP